MKFTKKQKQTIIDFFEEEFGIDLFDIDVENIICEINHSIPSGAEVGQATCKTLQKRFDIYAKAINDIDDFFEYRYKNLSNEQIKEIVMNSIDTITLKLSRLSDENNNE